MPQSKSEQANPEKVIASLLQQISNLSLQLAVAQTKIHDLQQTMQASEEE